MATWSPPTIGLLCLGRSDFNDIEMFRNDQFFRQSWGLRQIPSEPTLRQRLDAMRDLCGPILREESALLLRKRARKPTPCHGEWVALDIDVSPFDNSGTKKEGVSWTYKKVDGFAPIFACLGEEGYMVHCQLREKSTAGRDADSSRSVGLCGADYAGEVAGAAGRRQ